MAELYLVFQTASENPMAMTRFRRFLSKQGWQRIASGVYLHLDGSSFNEEVFWARMREEFAFEAEQDFVAVIHADRAFIPTRRYYNKPAPPWPKKQLE